MRNVNKALRFPLGGLAKDGSYRETTYPTEGEAYPTPNALNVFGDCSLEGRSRGGSRPGLKNASGVVSGDTGKWLWPDGDEITVLEEKEPWTHTGVPEGFHISAFGYAGYSVWYMTISDDLGNTYNASHDASRNAESLELVFYGMPVTPSPVVTSTRRVELTRFVFPTEDEAKLPDGSVLTIQHPSKTVYRNRLVKAEGSVWMASRTGDFGNFDFGDDAGDVTRAVAGNIAAAGEKGETITALCPIDDQRLYIATKRRLAVVSGEPTSAVSTISTNVGIISADAWCNVSGTLFFMGPRGLYSVAEGMPVIVSQRIPEDLKGWSSATLVFDPHYVGIHIFRNESGATGITDWFYDIANKAFWPMEYPATKMPDVGATVMIDGINRAIFRCVDGVWRYWDDDQLTDDGTAIRSHVTIGPFKCGTTDNGDGMLDSLNVDLAGSSASVSLGVMMAKTAQSAATCTASADTFTMTSDFNAIVRPRRRGAWCRIDINSTGRWAYESIQANIKTLGRIRP